MRGPHILEVPAGADIGGYVVDVLLGAGGYGRVYRAARGGELVALKLQSLEHLRGWAQREVAILLRLAHRNVVGFRGCGLYPERAPRWFYLAMEYVPGRTLSQWVEEENPSARRAAELLRGLARGLEAAHAAAVLHRDIKESNVVVREEDGEPVLVDFGVGDYAGAPRVTSGVLPPGTPRYRSPQALAFRRDSRPGQRERYVPTPADDLYALGVVFYWVLTGRHPFTGGESLSEVEVAISEEPRAPHGLNPRVPLELSGLCMRLLSKQPEARGGAKGLREDVEALLGAADAGWEVPLGEARSEGDAVPGELEAWVREGAGVVGPPRRGGGPKLSGWMEPPRGDGFPHPMRVLGDEGPEQHDSDWGVPPRGGGLPHPARSLLGGPERVPTLEVRARPAARPEAAPLAEVLFRATAVLGMAVGLALAVLLSLEWRPSAHFTDLAGAMAGAAGAPPSREVAPVGAPPESERAAAPLLAVSPPAAVASQAASPQEGAVPVNVKKTPDAPAPPPEKSRALKSMARVVSTVAVCTGLSCASAPPLRPPPPPSEPCPPGAVEAMRKLGIRVEETGGVSFVGLTDKERVVTVREQRVRVQVGASLGALAQGTLVGQLFLGEHLYGRYTEGHTKGGERFPVCLQIIHFVEQRPGWKLGMPLEPDGVVDGTARVWSGHDVMAVDHFE